ncbi:hypothetical protein DAEQUDRAFT_295256 [Daedalea quercina L-15889]|uniref:AB hydrolase-1 domain-containing protein n=1 Tax=Daedalea quercina L-15889 TaxID=1314783 RepID=A0A165U0T6_9APHY|nr:hypothetical protein DAEQUDRAFT_295256 [Daedalea quercina L-15889]
MPEVHTVTHLVDLCHVGKPLVTMAKRYTPVRQTPAPQTPSVSSITRNTVTLIFMHALAHHKEIWEPVISRLFALEILEEGGVSIAEIWTIDCPDHGESAALNRDAPPSVLRSGRVSQHTYGGAVLALMRSGFIRGCAHSRLVLIGHCAGASAIVLSTTYPHSFDDIPISAMILVEPLMTHTDMAAEGTGVRAILDGRSQSALQRRDVWASRDEARAYLRTTGTWKLWNASVLDSYLTYGLSSGQGAGGVTLSYPKCHEGAAYTDLGEAQDALNRLSELSSSLPVHMIFGEDHPTPLRDVQAMMCSRAHRRNMASITVLPKTGHGAPQQSPKLVAEAIWKILVKSSRPSRILCGKL